jgi:hypothetical protein
MICYMVLLSKYRSNPKINNKFADHLTHEFQLFDLDSQNQMMVDFMLK